MFQYRQFLKKEFIIIIQQKKLILSFIIMCFYPLVQLLANKPLLPINYIMPCLISFIILLPTDITRIIYNMEITSKTDEILKISNINKHIIIASKLTIPLGLSIGMLGITLMINNVLPNFTNMEIAKGFINTYYIIYCILIMIFSNLFCILVALIKSKYRDAKESTQFAFYIFIICFILYAIKFIVGYWLIYIILFSAILILYIKIFMIYSNSQTMNVIKQTNKSINSNSTYGTLSCFINNFFMSTGLLITIIIIFNLFLSVINHYYLSIEIDNLSIFLISLLVSIAIGNKFIFLGVINTKKYKIYSIIKNSSLSTLEFIWVHINKSVTLSLIFNLLLGLALMMDINNILNIFLIILEVNLFTLLSSFLVKSIKFYTYYALLNSIIIFLLLSTLIVLKINFYILIILITLTLLAIYFIYKKLYHYYFE